MQRQPRPHGVEVEDAAAASLMATSPTAAAATVWRPWGAWRGAARVLLEPLAHRKFMFALPVANNTKTCAQKFISPFAYINDLYVCCRRRRRRRRLRRRVCLCRYVHAIAKCDPAPRLQWINNLDLKPNPKSCAPAFVLLYVLGRRRRVDIYRPPPTASPTHTHTHIYEWESVAL